LDFGKHALGAHGLTHEPMKCLSGVFWSMLEIQTRLENFDKSLRTFFEV